MANPDEEAAKLIISAMMGKKKAKATVESIRSLVTVLGNLTSLPPVINFLTKDSKT